MHFKDISRFLGRYLFYLSLILLIPLGVAAYFQFCLSPLEHPQTHSTIAFLQTFFICLALALLFSTLGKKASGQLHRKESIFLVVIIWFVTAGIGSLPFTFTKTLEKPLDAYFEAMSGLSTTGATILFPKAYDAQTGEEVQIDLPELPLKFYGTVAPVRDPISKEILFTGVEAVGKALLFWRSFLQWLGGMGIVVLFIAVFPALAIGGKFLFETEVAGPSKEAIVPRIKATASLLWKIYFGLTALQVLLLILTNPVISFFDALTLSFSTISTGGFSIHNAGISAYGSSATEWVVLLFMILGSINFTLYFHCMRGKIYKIYEPEFFAFLFTLIFSSLLLSLTLAHTYPLGESLRLGFFQAISSQTSTGFSMTNALSWPLASQFLMVLLFYIGGMSGSTTGGVKIARFLILFRSMAHKIESIFRPSSVRCLKIGKKEISDGTVQTVLIYFCIVIFSVMVGTFVLIVDGLDATSALSTISSLINNAGLEFSPDQSCAFLPPLSKAVGIIWMALGRLEFFALLVFLVPAFWRSK